MATRVFGGTRMVVTSRRQPVLRDHVDVKRRDSVQDHLEQPGCVHERRPQRHIHGRHDPAIPRIVLDTAVVDLAQRIRRLHEVRCRPQRNIADPTPRHCVDR